LLPVMASPRDVIAPQSATPPELSRIARSGK
jgi:hypothetical protein